MYRLEVAIVDPDSTVKVVHHFFGADKSECEDYMAEHLDVCEYFSENAATCYSRFVEIPDGEAPAKNSLTEADGWGKIVWEDDDDTITVDDDDDDDET